MKTRAMCTVVVRTLAIVVGLVMAGPVTVAAMQRVDFEDLTLGQTFALGDEFSDSGVQMKIEPLLAEDGLPVPSTTAAWTVSDPIFFGDTGLSLILHPCNLRFGIPERLAGLTLRFRQDQDGAGPVNLEINGDWRWAEHMADLNGTIIGDVEVAVYGGGIHEPSFLRLTGSIYALAIGGTRMPIDDVSPVLSGPSLFYADSADSPGSVLEYRGDLDTITAVYTRATGEISNFSFAPWDPHRLYFVSGRDSVIFEVDLDSPWAQPSQVLTHTTTVTDLAFGPDAKLYFSEATGAAADGIIWRIEPDGMAYQYMTVPIASIGGYWAGDFAFSGDGTLYLTNGYLGSAAVYRVDPMNGSIDLVYDQLGPNVVGLAFSTSGDAYYSDGKERAYRLDLATGIGTEVYFGASLTYLSDIQVRELAPAQPVVDGLWVMPYGIGNLRFDEIAPATGLVTYSDSYSGRTMTNAPFGGTLALRMSCDSEVESTESLHYYRWSYRQQGAVNWIDLTAAVNIHYVKNRPNQTPVFPLFQLGPVEVNGMNLYRFRPSVEDLGNDDAVLLGPGESVEWPAVPLTGDQIRGYLNSSSLEAGLYELRFEVFDSSGTRATPGIDYELILPDGLAPDGTIETDPAPLMEGGTELVFAVDNRPCTAEILPPIIGAAVTDDCGFLRYTADSDTFELKWNAWHPAGHGFYVLDMVKGQDTLSSLPNLPAPWSGLAFEEEVSSSAHGSLGNGWFSEAGRIRGLLGTECDEAAFAVQLHVLAKATTGNGHRIHTYDAHDTIAFAVAEN